MSERFFIAGPYCPYGADAHDAARLAQRNVDKALEVANALIDMGHFVFVPHVSHYIHTHYSNKSDKGAWWYEEDNTFLDHWATALFFISSSRGADKELERAKKLKLKIYYSLDEVPVVENVNRADLNENERLVAIEQYRADLGLEKEYGFIPRLSKVTGIPESTLKVIYDVQRIRELLIDARVDLEDAPTGFWCYKAKRNDVISCIEDCRNHLSCGEKFSVIRAPDVLSGARYDWGLMALTGQVRTPWGELDALDFITLK